jgi:hypothetical protein
MVDSPDSAAAKRLLHAAKEAGFVFQRIAPGEDAPLLGLRQSSPPQRCPHCLWVPNWSSTAVTCDIGGSGSPTLFRAIPSNCPCGRFDQFEERAQPRYLAEPITTVITDARQVPWRDPHRCTVVSRRPSINVQRPDVLVSGLRRVDQRRIMVGLVSVPEAATGR